MTAAANLYSAWIGIFLGCVAGAAQGLFFHREQWMGGYGSWRRRMLRLGHISWFGIGILNLAFALTVDAMAIDAPLLPSALFLAGAAGMPVVCYMSAFRQEFRRLFFIPALSVIAAAGAFVWRLVLV
jgi:hypothetical protein